MPRDTDAQLEQIRAELIKEQTALDQMQEHITSIVDFDGNRTDYKSEKLPSDRLVVTEREFNLIGNCIMYASSDPAGLPGHNLMILVAKLAEHLDKLDGSDYEPESRTAPMPYGIGQ